MAQQVKKPPAMQETQETIPELGRSAGGGNGTLFQDSCLEKKNLMGRGAWQATVHGATKSQTQLSD